MAEKGMIGSLVVHTAAVALSTRICIRHSDKTTLRGSLVSRSQINLVHVWVCPCVLRSWYGT